MNTFAMAWRNVWRNSRRTAATVSAMSLALLTVILYAGLFEGYLRGTERSILDLDMGSAQIFAPGYQRAPSLFKRIADPDTLLHKLDAAGIAAAPRLLASGLAAAGETSSGASLRGIDVVRDAKVGKIATHVESGHWLRSDGPDEVVIGKRLAKTLALGVGGKITILSQAADGSMANAVYTVVGVLQSVGDAVDRSGVYMTAAAFRDLMEMPVGAQQIILRFADGADLAKTTATARALAPDLDTRSWRELSPTLASMLDSSRASMLAMFFIIYIAVGIVIFNAVLMAVFERVREFGVLKAIGVGPWQVMSLILLESAVQTALAIVIGVSVSIPANAYLATYGIDLASMSGTSVMGIAMDTTWRSVLTPGAYVLPIVLLSVIVACAALYPALRAALFEPVEAMRSQ